MNELIEKLLHALGTVLFQEGFDRKDQTGEKLEYYQYPKCSEIIGLFCEDVKYGSVNLSTKKIDDKWYLSLWEQIINEDDYGYEDRENEILAFIPIDPERLCWEIGIYCKKICKILECEVLSYGK